jgi:hypothetical protein
VSPIATIDFGAFDAAAHSARRLEHARAVWRNRVRTEYQSAQVATRFLGEVLAAGDPFDVQRLLVEVIGEELDHAELCAAMCRALGADAPAPGDVAAPLHALDPVPLDERVIATAISMFLVNETFSVGYLEDLVARCDHPVVGPVLRAILGDEGEHGEFAETFLARHLANESAARMAEWRGFTTKLIRGHLDQTESVLAALAPEERDLARHPEPELAALGLASDARLALVGRRTFEEVLRPRVARLSLAS